MFHVVLELADKFVVSNSKLNNSLYEFSFINLISKPQFSSETALNSSEIYST